jgi:hypothetical protein
VSHITCEFTPYQIVPLHQISHLGYFPIPTFCSNGGQTPLSPQIWPICPFSVGLHTRFSQILAMFTRGDVFLGERHSTGPVEPHEVGEVSSVRLLK